MALKVFDGIPGMGKTYNAMVLEILPHLAEGGFVVTNIEVKLDGIAAYLKERYGKIFNPERLLILTEEQCPTFFSYLPRGTADCPVKVVLDEIHLWFNARDWQKNDAKVRETFNLATQHRKFHLDIILISQNLSNIDGQFLKLVAGITRFKDLSKTPLFKWAPWFRVPYFRFLALHFDRTGKTRLDANWLRADKLAFASYNTLAVLKGGEAMEGSATVQRESLPVDPVFKAKMAKYRKNLLVALVLALVALNLWQLFRPSPDAPPPVPPSPQASIFKQKAAEPQKEEALQTHEEPKHYMEAPPVVHVLTACAVSGRSSPRVLVELDGVNQWLRSGGWCTRGRVGAVRSLSSTALHEVEIYGDDGERYQFRVVLKYRPSSSGPAPSQAVVPAFIPGPNTQQFTTP